MKARGAPSEEFRITMRVDERSVRSREDGFDGVEDSIRTVDGNELGFANDCEGVC